MKSKKIISGLLALSFVFGGTAIPGAVANNSVVASAVTSATEVLAYGDFEYTILNDGTVEIAKYIGSDTEVEIPAEIDGAAVTSIGQHAFYAFYGCSSEEDEQEVKNRTITSIVIPDSVIEINKSAFEGCRNLESITLPKNLKYIGMYAFLGCEEIKSFVIPDSVEEIDHGAFRYCSNLRNITLPKNLKKIDGYVFWNCESLEGITLSEGLKEIKVEAFF